MYDIERDYHDIEYHGRVLDRAKKGGANSLVERLRQEFADNPIFVLGQIEAYARDELCDPCLTPRQRLTQIVRVINTWDLACRHRKHTNP